MMLTVETVRETTPNTFVVNAQLGDESIDAIVEYSDTDGLEGFNIDGQLFGLLLHFGGLEGVFSRTFFEYRETRMPILPWQLGDLDADTLAQVSKEETKMRRWFGQQET